MPEALDPALRDIVTILPREGVSALAGVHVNPDLTIVARNGMEPGDYRYFVPEFQGGLHRRVAASLSYLLHLRAVALEGDRPLRHDGQIVFQLEDNPVDVLGVSWEAQRGWQNVRLIPDLYYFSARGYEEFDPALAPWVARRPSLIWRGSSTGLFWQTQSALDDLPRYRMCKLAAQLGAGADVGLTDLVQAANPEEAELIRERVSCEGLLKPFVPMTEMALHRFILDIDGNSNSWNFMQKLRLGCCVLRVESRWQQWFSDRLTAWEHYVPIASDLSDFIERAEWCFANPAECSAIAERGKRFASEMKFADEMSRAASNAFAASGANVRDDLQT
jgi:hypothetical protein